MNLLFVTSRFPYPPLKGDKIRAYYPIKLLSKKHRIDLLSFSEERVAPYDLHQMEQYCRRIEVVNLNNVVFHAKLVFGILTPCPSQVFCYKSSRMRKIIRKYLHTDCYDLVHIVCGRLAEYTKCVGKVPKVIDWIDALSLSTKRMYTTEDFWPKKLLYYLEWNKMRRYERKNLSASDFAFVTSQVDKTYLGDNSVQVIPNGVDTDMYHPSGEEKDIDLIFTGNMGYFVNIQAVQFFCEKIFPLVLQERPQTTFFVVGADTRKSVLKYHDGKNVIVAGYAEDLKTMLNRSRIYVASLQSGAGIQNKILEAMACSLPVITTSYGNAGIRAKKNHTILIKDDPKEFADAVLDLLTDESKRRTLGKNGLQLVTKHFSWASMIDVLNAAYNNLLKNTVVRE